MRNLGYHGYQHTLKVYLRKWSGTEVMIIFRFRQAFLQKRFAAFSSNIVSPRTTTELLLGRITNEKNNEKLIFTSIQKEMMPLYVISIIISDHYTTSLDSSVHKF